jgi:septin family protein
MSSDSGQLPTWGTGVGKGGGSGGSVRESGGAFGVREAVMEEQYFRRLTEQQLEHLHDHYVDEIQYLQKQLKEQQDAIDAKKKRLRELKEVTKLI